MLSARLIHQIEDHWESLAIQVIAAIRDDRELTHLRKLPESELWDWGQGILKNLGRWLVSRQDEVAGHYETAGRHRYHESVPLAECVRATIILKDTMLGYIRHQGLGSNAVELYAEEELEHNVGRFFDTLLYHLVKGYESAARPALHAHA